MKTKKISFTYNMCSNDLTILKKELTWLKEVDATSLQNSLRNLDVAYMNFFNENRGYPKFKSKKYNYHSYRTTCINNNIRFEHNKIRLPKLGILKIHDKKLPQGKILNATVSQEPSGKYYVSLCCTDVDIQPLEKVDKIIGIDLGIKEFCVTSNGELIPNPHYLKKSLKKT